jgi:hypothetical protein
LDASIVLLLQKFLANQDIVFEAGGAPGLAKFLEIPLGLLQKEGLEVFNIDTQNVEHHDRVFE